VSDTDTVLVKFSIYAEGHEKTMSHEVLDDCQCEQLEHQCLPCAVGEMVDCIDPDDLGDEAQEFGRAIAEVHIESWRCWEGDWDAEIRFDRFEWTHGPSHATEVELEWRKSQ